MAGLARSVLEHQRHACKLRYEHVDAAVLVPVGERDRPARAGLVDLERPEAPATVEETWRDIELSDARTGETFTLASLEGQPVAIEPFAVWCSSCKIQNDNVREAYADIEPTGIRWISLGVEPNEHPDTIAKYANRQQYPWTFAQSPTEMSRALNDIFGPQILSVPSTPLIILDETGEIVLQDFGIHNPDQLVEIVDEVLAGTL